MKMRSVVATVVAVLTFPLIAGDFTLKSAPQSLADWRNGAFYEEGSAPDEDGTAVIDIPTGMEAEITDAMIDFANAIQRFKPEKKAKIVFNFESSHSLTCAVYRIPGDSSANSGTFVKKGAGALYLASKAEKSTRGDYEVNIDVQGGLVRMPVYDANQKIHDRTLAVNIAAGATFVPAVNANTGKDAATQIWAAYLTGEGTLSNDRSDVGTCTFLLGASGKAPYVFDGDLNGKVNFLIYGGHQYFTKATGAASYSGIVTIQGANAAGTAGIFGFADPNLAKGNIYSAADGSRIIYLGDSNAAIAGSYFVYSQSSEALPNVIDGGHHGGLTWNGLLRLYSDAAAMRLTLAGTNTVPCVVAGEIRSLYNDGSLFINKIGSGTWRFADYSGSNRSALSGFWIKEGTIGFETYGETNVSSCAFGRTPWFIADTPGPVVNAVKLPYQFRLGDSAGGTEGSYEYYGNGRFIDRTRPFAIDGTGRIVHSSSEAGSFGHYEASVTALGDDSTLVLDGEQDEPNDLVNLQDGDGKLAVEKRGAGTWTIGGTNNTFSGDIAVKAGTLVLRGVSGKFTWFRWTCTGVWNENGCYVEITQLGLFDKENKRVNGDLVLAPNALPSTLKSGYGPSTYPKVAPGEVCYGDTYEFAWNASALASLFQTSGAGRLYTNIKGHPILMSDPDSRMSVVFRLPRNSKEVASYDLGCQYRQDYQDKAMAKSWFLEGSVDGETWYKFDTVEEGPTVGNTKYWFYTNTGITADNCKEHPGGRPCVASTNDIVVVYDNPVSVAEGATLEAEGLVRLSSFKADLTKAGGTVKGFQLADEVTLDVTGDMPKGTNRMKLPLSFEDVGNLPAGENWTVKVDGKESTKYSAEVVDGEVYLLRRGLVLIVR